MIHHRDDYIKLTKHHTDRNMYNELTNCYIDNLLFLREKELPITKMNNLTHLIQTNYTTLIF